MHFSALLKLRQHSEISVFSHHQVSNHFICQDFFFHFSVLTFAEDSLPCSGVYPLFFLSLSTRPATVHHSFLVKHLKSRDSPLDFPISAKEKHCIILSPNQDFYFDYFNINLY